jgi:hypothetical protein
MCHLLFDQSKNPLTHTILHVAHMGIEAIEARIPVTVMLYLCYDSWPPIRLPSFAPDRSG